MFSTLTASNNNNRELRQHCWRFKIKLTNHVESRLAICCHIFHALRFLRFQNLCKMKIYAPTDLCGFPYRMHDRPERDPFTIGHPPLYLIHSSCPPFSRLSVELHPCETIVVAYFWSADQINMCVYDYDTRIVMLTHKYFYASATTLSRNR